MKNMVAMEVAGAAAAQAGGRAAQAADLIFAGVADEEAGCEWGSLWLAEHHPDKVRAEYAISEIGGFSMHVGGRVFYPVQVAEKGLCWLTITGGGDRRPRLAAQPRQSDRHHRACGPAPGGAAPAGARHPRHRAASCGRWPTTSRCPNSLVLRALLSKPLCDHVLDRVFPDPDLASTFDAVLHNTANPDHAPARRAEGEPGAGGGRPCGWTGGCCRARPAPISWRRCGPSSDRATDITGRPRDAPHPDRRQPTPSRPASPHCSSGMTPRGSRSTR